jgi:hypothetical protein
MNDLALKKAIADEAGEQSIEGADRFGETGDGANAPAAG